MSTVKGVRISVTFWGCSRPLCLNLAQNRSEEKKGGWKNPLCILHVLEIFLSKEHLSSTHTVRFLLDDFAALVYYFPSSKSSSCPQILSIPTLHEYTLFSIERRGLRETCASFLQLKEAS